MFQLTSFLIIYLKYSTVTPNFHLFSHFSTMNIVIKKCKNANELDLGLRIFFFCKCSFSFITVEIHLSPIFICKYIHTVYTVLLDRQTNLLF